MTVFDLTGEFSFSEMGLAAECTDDARQRIYDSVGSWMDDVFPAGWIDGTIVIGSLEEQEGGLWCADVSVFVRDSSRRASSQDEAIESFLADLEGCMDEWVPLDPTSAGCHVRSVTEVI